MHRQRTGVALFLSVYTENRIFVGVRCIELYLLFIRESVEFISPRYTCEWNLFFVDAREGRLYFSSMRERA